MSALAPTTRGQSRDAPHVALIRRVSASRGRGSLDDVYHVHIDKADPDILQQTNNYWLLLIGRLPQGLPIAEAACPADAGSARSIS